MTKNCQRYGCMGSDSSRPLSPAGLFLDASTTCQHSASGVDRVLAHYDVEKLTLAPWEMNQSDVVALREQGFSDSAILDINQVTGYYAFANRLADGLGIELEATHKE